MERKIEDRKWIYINIDLMELTNIDAQTSKSITFLRFFKPTDRANIDRNHSLNKLYYELILPDSVPKKIVL